MSEWITTKVGALGKVVTGKTPSKNNPEDWGDKYLFITPSDYSNYNKYANHSIRGISYEGYKRHKVRMLPKNSCLVTCIGSDMGKVVKNAEDAFCNQQINALIPNAAVIDSDYAYYFFKDSELLLKTLGGDGTAVPILNKSDFEKIELSIPPLPEQKAIASVLSSLDDKIDLLHRQNKTLEAMAETLFRQWFIEEAKEDWSEFYIRDLEIYIADYVANGSFASLKENVTLITERSDYALFIRNTDLKSNFANKVYVDEHSYNFLVKTKLYGGEVIISNVADVGSVHLCPRFNIPMTLGNNIIMLRSKFNYFLYLYFTSNVGQDALYAITSGSAQQKFNKTDFRALKISLPNLAILDEFNELVSPYFIKKEYNLNQIQTLENLRDTLLPKLMSGEVRVQYQTEEVA